MPTLEALRGDVATLTRLVEADLEALLSGVTDGVVARNLLIDTLPSLVNGYGSAAATLAADWYDEYRAEERIAGRFRSIPAELPDQGRTDALARWGVEPLFAPEPDTVAAVVRVAGGVQRIVTNAGRYTITGSSIEDRSADGWQRTGSGTSCSFCAILIARGAVYSERGADFASHDRCDCFAIPAFNGRPRPVKPYTPSKRNISAADRARVREYIRTH